MLDEVQYPADEVHCPVDEVHCPVDEVHSPDDEFRSPADQSLRSGKNSTPTACDPRTLNREEQVGGRLKA